MYRSDVYADCHSSKQRINCTLCYVCLYLPGYIISRDGSQTETGPTEGLRWDYTMNNYQLDITHVLSTARHSIGGFIHTVLLTIYLQFFWHLKKYSNSIFGLAALAIFYMRVVWIAESTAGNERKQLLFCAPCVRDGGMGMEEVRAQVQQCGDKGFIRG